MITQKDKPPQNTASPHDELKIISLHQLPQPKRAESEKFPNRELPSNRYGNEAARLVDHKTTGKETRRINRLDQKGTEDPPNTTGAKNQRKIKSTQPK